MENLTEYERALLYLSGKPTPMVVPFSTTRLGLPPAAALRGAFGLAWRQGVRAGQHGVCACLDCSWTVGES